jgi:hypothetical protein
VKEEHNFHERRQAERNGTARRHAACRASVA